MSAVVYREDQPNDNVRRFRMVSEARLYSLADSLLLCWLLVVLAVQLRAEQAVQATPALMLALGAVAVAACLKLRQVQEESVLVVADMGVQLTVSYRFGGQSCRFIDMADVQDILVNEGIAQQRTRYYLAFVVRGEGKLVLAFQHFTPRLDDLLCVYRGTRATCGLLGPHTD